MLKGYDEWLESPYTNAVEDEENEDMCEWCDRDPYLCFCE